MRSMSHCSGLVVVAGSQGVARRWAGPHATCALGDAAAACVGEWRDNLKEGRGVYYWPKGGVYEGEWRGGKMEGLGVRTWSTGKVKVGGEPLSGQGAALGVLGPLPASCVRAGAGGRSVPGVGAMHAILGVVCVYSHPGAWGEVATQPLLAHARGAGGGVARGAAGGGP